MTFVTGQPNVNTGKFEFIGCRELVALKYTNSVENGKKLYMKCSYEYM